MSEPLRPIASADHVSKWYGQVIGLNDVSVSVPAGELAADEGNTILAIAQKHARSRRYEAQVRHPSTAV